MNLSVGEKTLALLLSLFRVAWSAPVAPYTVQDCFDGFLALQFQGLNFDAYPTYYDDDSVFVLPQTGTYTGAEAIEEYVRFVDVDSTPYWDGRTAFDQSFTFSATRFDSIAGNCVFSLVSTQALVYSAELTAGDTVNYAAFRNIVYSIPRNKITSLTQFYNPALLGEFFGRLATPGINSFICGVLEGPGCTNALGRPPKSARQQRKAIRRCERALAELPISEGDNAYIDGNTQGCRSLHAVFAQQNTFHCAHIALEPTPDPAGVTKCAVSEEVDPMATFTEDEIQIYYDFCADSPDVDDNCYRFIPNPNPPTESPGSGSSDSSSSSSDSSSSDSSD